jgi:hypothetical protein
MDGPDSPQALDRILRPITTQHRGNPTYVYQYGDNLAYSYDTSGVVTQVINGTGLTTAVSSRANYSLPGILTPMATAASRPASPTPLRLR